MTDSERLWTGVAVSLFLHFSLTLWHPAAEEEKSVFRAVLEMDSRPSALPDATRQGTGVESVSANNREEAEQLDRRRRAYLRYIEDVDDAIHARRLVSGDTGLIGAALCAFTLWADGTFSSPQIVSTSGRPELDASALRAVRAASGAVRRPDILGSDPIHVSLQVKYQYGLE